MGMVIGALGRLLLSAKSKRMAEHVVSWRVALSKAQVLKQEKLAKKRKKELAASQKELEQIKEEKKLADKNSKRSIMMLQQSNDEQAEQSITKNHKSRGFDKIRLMLWLRAQGAVEI